MILTNLKPETRWGAKGRTHEPFSLPKSKMLHSAETGDANSFLLHKGWIAVKKGLIATKKYAALCAPTTISDIQALYEFLFIAESNTPVPLDEKAIPWLGSIAFSAVRGKFILIQGHHSLC